MGNNASITSGVTLGVMVGNYGLHLVLLRVTTAYHFANTSHLIFHQFIN